MRHRWYNEKQDETSAYVVQQIWIGPILQQKLRSFELSVITGLVQRGRHGLYQNMQYFD